ncbi:MAG: hypothetical protein ACYC4P_20445 [Thermoanaerobaculia bacterium]
MGDAFVIQCPDCDSTLKVDRETGAVLSHEPAAAKRKLGSIEEAAAEIARRKERAEDLFAANVEREKHKSEILEKTFREALQKAQKEPPGRPRSPFDAD